MPSVVITCGLAFSGKSTAARSVADALGYVLVSLDAINHERDLRGGEGIPVAEWERTSHLAMDRVRAHLLAGRSVIVDDTFSRRFLRDRARGVAEAGGARFVILHLATPLPVIEARRARNDRAPTRHAVRQDVFQAHKAEFEPPAADEPVVRLADELDLRVWLDDEARLAATGAAP